MANTGGLLKRAMLACRGAEPASPVVAFWVVEDVPLQVVPSGARVVRDYVVDRSEASGRWGGELRIFHRVASSAEDCGRVLDAKTKRAVGRVERDASLFPPRGAVYPRDRLVFAAGGV